MMPLMPSKKAGAALLAALFSSAVFAIPYATNLSAGAANFTPGSGSITLKYLLNDDTTNVTIDIKNRATGQVVKSETFTNLTRGEQTYVWNGRNNANQNVSNGQYTFSITATTTGYTEWTPLFNPPLVPTMSFWFPNDVAVNKNPDSPFFGRVYVLENGGIDDTNVAGGRTAEGRLTEDGVYLLNADGTDAVGQGDTARMKEPGWQLDNPASSAVQGTSSPFRMTVAPDDRIFVCDWSDAHSGVWAADANALNTVQVLDNSGIDSNGLNYQHGSISGVLVQGKGSQTAMYVIDEDFGSSDAQLGSIWRYSLGARSLATPYTGTPILTVDDGALGDKLISANLRNDFVRDNAGDWWAIQSRFGLAGETLASLVKYKSDGSALLYSSVPDEALDSQTDPYRGNNAIAYDARYNRLAFATGVADGQSALVHVVDILPSGLPDTLNGTKFTLSSGSGNRGIDFDAAGNVYVVNNSAEILQVMSPPGPSTFTTNFSGSFNAGPTFTLSGTISLEGFTENAAAVELTLIVRPAGNLSQTVATYKVRGGAYSVSVPSGNYSVAVQGATYLRDAETVNLTANRTLNFSLKTGDVNQDNKVDDFDLFALTTDFLATVPQGNTDLTGDAFVDDFDLFALTTNFLTDGEL